MFAPDFVVAAFDEFFERFSGVRRSVTGAFWMACLTCAGPRAQELRRFACVGKNAAFFPADAAAKGIVVFQVL